ncbi:MAG: helix-hairpin-helix domain-containing protein [Promethearchaeota archaeon]|jgi:predicted flap endonuclease-1-like 5' DNA nuclease
MGNKIILTATVKSPSRGSFLRAGEGFSIKEIKDAGRDINQVMALNVKIDFFRKTSYPENVEKLKKLKILEKKGGKRKPFVKKEKKSTPFKPIEDRIKQKPKKVITKAPKVPAEKKKVEKTKKEKLKPEKKEKGKAEEKGIPLTELSGLGAATAKKFAELGVSCVEDLTKENPKDLASLIKGVSEDRLSKWIEECKDLIKG